MISSESLLMDIRKAFPVVEMPAKESIIFSSADDGYFDGLLEDIECYRGREVSVELIRMLHQELSNLSLGAWLWIMPHYLEYCLSSDAEYSQMETEFLIYALSPLPKYRSDVLGKLSGFSLVQVKCLVRFIEWCQRHKYWRKHFSSELAQAKDFLVQLESQIGRESRAGQDLC